MGTYREQRNIESSIIDFLKYYLAEDGWNNIRVEKVFSEVYGTNKTFPCILVEILNINPIVTKEIGSKIQLKNYNINIRIFATSDGLREDLADWLFSILETNTIEYCEYIIQSGDVETQVPNGNINIRAFTRNEKELANTLGLEKEDKYRSIISFRAYIS